MLYDIIFFIIPNTCTCLKYQENSIQINKNIQYKNNGAMDIGDSPRETVLPTLKHTLNTFSKTIIFDIYILIFFRKKPSISVLL